MALNMEETYPDAFEDKEMSEEMQRKLQSILEKYQHLSDEEKEQFQQGAFDVLTKSLKNKLHSNTTIWPISYHSMILFISAVLLVVFLLGIVLLTFFWILNTWIYNIQYNAFYNCFLQ